MRSLAEPDYSRGLHASSSRSAASPRRRKIHERIAIFPSVALTLAEQEISSNRRELHRRIVELRAELADLRTTTETSPLAASFVRPLD